MNEHNECPCCPVLRAQAEAVDNALREVGAPVALPGQEGTLLPPDRIRQMAKDGQDRVRRLQDRIRWAEIVLNAVGQVCQIQTAIPTSEDEAVDYARKLHAVTDAARSIIANSDHMAARLRGAEAAKQANAHVFERAAAVYGHRDPERLGDQIVAAQIAVEEARKDAQKLLDARQQVSDLEAERDRLRREVADAKPVVRAALDTFGEHPGAWLADAIRRAKAERDEEARTVERLAAQVGEMEARVGGLERTLSTTRYERDRARDGLDAARQEIAKLRAQLERDQELFQLLRR